MTVYPDNNPKSRAAADKPTFHAIPPSALQELGKAMLDGKNKYGLMNFRESSIAASVYYDAIQRHLQDWWDGEDFAPDSGVHHLGHIMACCACYLDAMVQDTAIDDRPIMSVRIMEMPSPIDDDEVAPLSASEQAALRAPVFNAVREAQQETTAQRAYKMAAQRDPLAR